MTIPGQLLAASKLEITDPRAAKIREVVTQANQRVRAVERVMVRSSSSQTTVGFVITGQIYDVWSKNLSLNVRKCVLSPTTLHLKDGDGR